MSGLGDQERQLAEDVAWLRADEAGYRETAARTHDRPYSKYLVRRADVVGRIAETLVSLQEDARRWEAVRLLLVVDEYRSPEGYDGWGFEVHIHQHGPLPATVDEAADQLRGAKG